ncbi:hypothetical protein AAFF_G00132980 [Aldrovandia affinis]|uniref:Cytochrome P450 n=1 Tax=Aldrovandia affinis TaxID=143900 RepID=A0AAD7W927_9TELE|nr:hypothetical protein AAFF_G00132980 [Aldrovandia affinis]
MALQVLLRSVLEWTDVQSLLLFLLVFLLISDHFRKRNPKNFPRGLGFALPGRINNCQGIALNSGYSWKQQRRFTVSTLRDFGVGKRSLESQILEEIKFHHQAVLEKSGEPFDAHFLVNNAVSNIICSIVFGRRFEYTDERFLLLLKLMSKAIQIQGSMWAQAYNSFPFIMKLLPGPHKEMFSFYRQACGFLREEIENHQKDWDPSAPRDFIDCYLSEIEKGYYIV